GSPGSETFDGSDFPALNLCSGNEARADWLVIEENSACAAVTRVASYLGSGQSEIFAQHARKSLQWICGNVDSATVDTEGGTDSGLGQGCHSVAHDRPCAHSSKARRTKVSAASSRYAAVARTSSIGLSRDRCAGVTYALIPLRIDLPMSSRSSSCRRRAVTEQAPTAIRTSCARPFSSAVKSAATMAIEITR